MSCRMCLSLNQTPFHSEIDVHFRGLGNVNRIVLAFPTLVVCMNCGFTELQLEDFELRQLKGDTVTDAAA